MGIQINGSTDRITAIDGTIDFVSNIGNIGLITASRYELLDSITIGAGSTIIKTVNGKLGIGEDAPTRNLHIDGTAHQSGIIIHTAGNHSTAIDMDSNRSSAAGGLAELNFKWNGTTVGQIGAYAGADTTNKDDGHIHFGTASAGSIVERLRITSTGLVQIGPTHNASTYGWDARLKVAVEQTGSDPSAIHFGESANGTANPAINFIRRDGSTLWSAYAGQISYDTGKFVFATSANAAPGSHSFGTKMVIKHSGNVGIGTDNPSGKLDISAANTTDMLMFKNGATNFAKIGYNSASGTAILDIRSEGHTRFLTNGNNERLRITSDGKIGINKSSPAYPLHVNGEGIAVDRNAGDPYISLRTSDDTKVSIYGGASTGFRVFTKPSGGSSAERLRTTPDGQTCINTTAVTNTHDFLTVKRPASGFGEMSMTVDANTSSNSAANAFIFTKSKHTYWNGYGFQSSHGHIGAIVGKRDSGGGDSDQEIRIEIGGTHINQSEEKIWQFKNNGDLSISDGDLVVASGHGINFSATANSSAGSSINELLDDYEEGQFTPTIGTHSNINSTSGIDSSHTGAGSYTKIGNQVTVTVDFNNLHGNARDHVLRYITGLPFTSASNNKTTAAIGYQRGLRFVYANDVFDGESGRYHHLYGHIGGSTTQMDLNGSMSYSPYSGWPCTHDSASSQYLRITITYFTPT